VDGPNLNVLGLREPSVYGTSTLEEIRDAVRKAAGEAGAEVSFFQSNHEGEIVEALQAARDRADAVVINPAAYTHTSVAIRDALSYAALPSVELHLSNPHRREPFRHVSTVSDVVDGRVAGFGPHGYVMALSGALSLLARKGR
jgi:3-dehydroquinate dehydratase-2